MDIKIVDMYNFMLKIQYGRKNYSFPIKIILLLLITLFAGISSGKIVYIAFSLIEIFIIVVFSSCLKAINKRLSYILGSIASFIFLLQQLALYYTGNYLSIIILDNINAYNTLGNMLPVYIVSIAIVIIISIMPMDIYLKYSGKMPTYLAILLLAFSMVIYRINKDIYSPCMSLSWVMINIMNGKIREYQFTHYNFQELDNKFSKDYIDGTDMYVILEEDKIPNIILIFAEGLSAEVLDVFNNLDLNLTPHLNRLYDNSIVFTNYYNHTAATYRGLRGQLISGYQFLGGSHINNDGFGQIDKSVVNKRMETNMVSLIDILNNYQYRTYFINTEPSNIQFSNYLYTFNFYKILSGDIFDRYLSDKEAFALLSDTIDKLEEPFFIGLYNIGTHVGMDSPDIKYGDGKNAVLNKFANYDVQFGLFYEKFMNSDISNDTILIFTTDHATFPLPEYKKAFNSSQQYFVNKIPLFLYWKNVEHEVIDVNGRNSLNLTPTILDLLNITNQHNYFLGESLFLIGEGGGMTITAIGDTFFSTKNNSVVKLFKHTQEVLRIKDFYKISINYSK